MQKAALPPRVHAPAIEPLALIRLPVADGEVEREPVPRGLIRLHAWPADLVDEQAADGQRVVADELGIEADTGLPGKELVERIGFALLDGRAGRLLISAAHHDRADKLFHIPPGVDKL